MLFKKSGAGWHVFRVFFFFLRTSNLRHNFLFSLKAEVKISQKYVIVITFRSTISINKMYTFLWFFLDYYDIHVYRSHIKTIITFDLILKIFRRRVLQGETCSFHITRLRPLGTHIRLQKTTQWIVQYES